MGCPRSPLRSRCYWYCLKGRVVYVLAPQQQSCAHRSIGRSVYSFAYLMCVNSVAYHPSFLSTPLSSSPPSLYSPLPLTPLSLPLSFLSPPLCLLPSPPFTSPLSYPHSLSPPHPPCLLGEDAVKFETLPDDVIVAKALSVLRSIFGDQTVPEVCSLHQVMW